MIKTSYKMKITPGISMYPFLVLVLVLIIISGCKSKDTTKQPDNASISVNTDPLPSWNDTPNKKAILTFVEKVTKEGSPDYVAPEERIATFDNDGTLWAEQPVPFQVFYIMDRIKELAPQHPEWKTKEPFASVLKNDLKSALSEGEKAVEEMTTQAGMTTSEYSTSVKAWIAKAKHPATGYLFTEMVYQPMLELLAYLRANGFKTYIVSGGGCDFVRAFSEKVYGVVPEQVIGTSFKTRYELRDGKPFITFLPEINFITVNDGKAIAIDQVIGRQSIASFGNSDGDQQMMQWTTNRQGLSLALLVHHTDSIREWAYDRKSADGKLDKALDEANAKGWIVVDMKKDWKIIYAFEKK
jgi:phosphoserine phosphatase